MKLKQIASYLAVGAIALTPGFTSLGVKASEIKASEEVSFICGDNFDAETGEYHPTTFAWRKRGKTPIIRWKTEKIEGYDPQTRCEQVSSRFNEAYHNGSINMMTNGIMNNSPVICTARKYKGDCDTLLMTLLPEDDSIKFLEELEKVFNGRSTVVPEHSTSTHQVYLRIDIDEFLRTAPVEQE